MPKTNSDSDFGGSITSDSDREDMDAGPSSPVATSHPAAPTLELPAPKDNLKTDKYENPASHNPAADPTSSPISMRSTQSFRTRVSRKPTVIDMTGESTTSTLRGAARFRATARKVLQMRQTSSVIGALRGVGAEPGIDPRRASAIASYGHIKENCSIEVVDYSSLRSKTQRFDNQEFVDYLDANGTTRESWAKVRWISIGGISWDVISTLALQYDLHPLSLEDVLHRRGHVRSKADYFSRHLFLRVLCHSLGDPQEVNQIVVKKPDATRITALPRSSSPAGLDEKDLNGGYEPGDDVESSDKSLSGLFRRKTRRGAGRKQTSSDVDSATLHPPVQRSETQAEAAAIATIDTLKAGERVNVLLRNLFIFLLRDGTVVSIHQTPTSEFATPILNRLRARDTVLRKTADPSLLVQSLLDLVVDQAMEVVEEYQKKILKLEHDILLKPKMRSVRYLHILSGDLTLHKRTMGPLKSLVYGLRRYDLDRCIAVAQSVAEDSAEADAASRKIVGYMSHKAKVYLADVHDHVEYILSSLDMFASVSENLINYTFNMASYEMNQVMRRLTLATIIFLPLTLLTGYFGMNFDPMWSVQANSDVLFWKIAIPVMAVVITLFMWNDIISAKHFAEKKMMVKRMPRPPNA